MVVRLSLRVRHHGCVTESLTGGSYATQITGDVDGEVILMRGESAAAVDAFLKADKEIYGTTPEILSREPDSVLYRGRNPAGGVIAEILSAGCHILWPAVFRDAHEFYEVVAPNKAVAAKLLEALRTIGDASIERLLEVPADKLDLTVSVAHVSAQMTGRQLEALHLAVASGYYDSPRKTDTERLAKAMGVSRSTFEEHLRKAEARALSRLDGILRVAASRA